MASARVVVRRSPWKLVVIGLVGVPLVLFVVDYVWGVAGLFDRVIEWSYGAKDPEAWEARDDILAALIAVVGGLMVLFSLKELLFPRRLLVATTDGIRLPLSGPFGRVTRIGWLQVTDVETDDRAVLFRLTHAGGVPTDPWGARWVEDRTLRVPTWWWDRSPDKVLDEIVGKGLPAEAEARRRELQMEEARAHAAAMELISGAAVVPDPTASDSEQGSRRGEGPRERSDREGGSPEAQGDDESDGVEEEGRQEERIDGPPPADDPFEGPGEDG